LSTKYSLVVAYSGQAFYGYQIQKNFRTVEGEIFKVLSKICSDVTKVSASGRTDTGVHSECQYVGFKTKKIFDINRTLFALRQLIPRDILVLSLEAADLDFDPRRSAKTREYRYLFKKGLVPLYLKERIVEVEFEPDILLFDQFRQILIGEHDFSLFRKSGSDEPNTVREVYDFSITTRNLKLLYDEENFSTDYFELKIIASAFLYRMVRNLTGAVFEVLKGSYDINEFKKYFNGKESTFNYKPAPAKGLSLVKVVY
jgi:tRNA pseudouridine38-40 synthase